MPEVIQYANVIDPVEPYHIEIAERVGGLMGLNVPPVEIVRHEAMRLPRLLAERLHMEDFALTYFRQLGRSNRTAKAQATLAWSALSRTDTFIARGIVPPPVAGYPVRFTAPDGSALDRSNPDVPRAFDVRTLATYVAMVDSHIHRAPSLIREVVPHGVHAKTVDFWRDFSRSNILALAGVPYISSPTESAPEVRPALHPGDTLIRITPEDDGPDLVLASEETLRQFGRQQAAASGKREGPVAERVWHVLTAVHRSKWTRQPPYEPSSHYGVKFLTVDGKQPRSANEPAFLELTSLAEYVAYVRSELYLHPARRSDMSRYMPRGLAQGAYDFWEALVSTYLPDFDLDKYISS